MGGYWLYIAGRMLSTPYRGIRHIEGTGYQLYVDEGACVRFEYEASGGLLLGVEILSSRWYFTDPGPTLRVYESSPATGARPGITLVGCTRAAALQGARGKHARGRARNSLVPRARAHADPRSRHSSAGAE